MSLEPGRHISQSFRLTQKIADGGMGSVWQAEHLTLNRTIALKFLSPALLQREEAVQRFVVEAQAVARIASPHVPQIFDFGTTEDGIPFIAMEYLEGEELFARLCRVGTLTVAEILRVVEHVCLALHEAHTLGIVHRDIKPENIFLVPDGPEGRGGFTAKLLDFGIAKAAPDSSLESLTRTGATLGTPSYMSPEQLMSSRDVDFQSDFWSLGVVAYYCLTGKLPFEGETFAAVCVAIDRACFILPSALRSGVAPAVDQWFQKALARDPRNRFASAREMSRALRSAFEGRPSAMALIGQPARPTRQASEPTLRGAVSATSTLDVVPKRSHAGAILASLVMVAALAAGLSPPGRAFLGRKLAAASVQTTSADVIVPVAPATPAPSVVSPSLAAPNSSAAASDVTPPPVAPSLGVTSASAALRVVPPATKRAPSPRSPMVHRAVSAPVRRGGGSHSGEGLAPNPYDVDPSPRASVGDPNNEQSHAEDLSRLVDGAAGVTIVPPPAPSIAPSTSDSKWNARDDLGEVKDEPKRTK